jgi:toxin ParE1/3/4
MNSYTFSDEAVRDLNEICDYIIAQNSSKAASDLFDAIRQKCKLVAEFPNMGKRYDMFSPNLRGFIVRNYLIFYYPRSDGIDIARVVRGDRDLALLFSELGEN